MANKQVTFKFRLEEDEKRAFEKAAHADGRTLSAWLRHLANEAIKEQRDDRTLG